jgi:hypothetical protein
MQISVPIIARLVIDKESIHLEKRLDRKKFFERTGKAFLFTALASLLPVKIFSSKKTLDKKVKVNIHPSAVKRGNKV